VKVWTLWIGDPPDLTINRCIERAGATILGATDVPRVIIDVTDRLQTVCDLFRLWWLYREGGVFLDADVWVNRWGWEERGPVVAFENERGVVTNPVLAARPREPVLAAAYLAGLRHVREGRFCPKPGHLDNRRNRMYILRRGLKMIRNAKEVWEDQSAHKVVHLSGVGVKEIDEKRVLPEWMHGVT
jgi:hypothetical protein